MFEDLIARLPALCGDDPTFLLAARGWDALVRLGSPQESVDVRLAAGRVHAVTRSSEISAVDVSLLADRQRWLDLFRESPPVGRGTELMAGIPPGGYQSSLVGGFIIDGDVVRALGPYGPAVTRLLHLAGHAFRGTIPASPASGLTSRRATDTAIGRYVYVDVEGIEYRVFYEEAGAGVPLLLQHTAGADARQWRHLLADPILQRSFRMIAFDLPYHGRSLPPTGGVPWWTSEYEPPRELLHAWILGIKRALGLDRPMFMGVSVGGQLAPELIARHPEEFSAAVAVNGWYHMDRLVGSRTNDFFHHPRISSEHFADLQYRMTSPAAPEFYRREVAWIYASSGPGVYRGDNQYFMHGHDMRPLVSQIDTRRTPLAVVVGEHDPAALVSDGGARELADAIPGARFHVLPRMSHFAMSDDPDRFNPEIVTILTALAESAGLLSPGSAEISAEVSSLTKPHRAALAVERTQDS